MTIFETNVRKLLANFSQFNEKDIPFFALANFTEEAGFDSRTSDGAVFATAVLITSQEQLPAYKDMVQLAMREYARAAVAGWRKGTITGFYDAIRQSVEDKLLPITAEDKCLENRNIGEMAFMFYTKNNLS